MARLFSQRVFDRPSGGNSCSRRIAADLDVLAADTYPIERAFGANVESDWRVSEEREQHFCSLFQTDLPPEEEPADIGQRLVYYFGKRIRGAANPDFLLPNNSVNRRNSINRETSFVTVLRLPDLPLVIEPGAKAVALGGLLGHAGTVDVLKELFPPGPFDHRSVEEAMILDDKQQRFLAACFSGMTPNYHPVWAGFWRDFLPFIEEGPDHWLAAFGVRSRRAQLCLLFRYQLEALKGAPVFMPTCLESNRCPEHFPTPAPRCGWKDSDSNRPFGGHPASLRPQTDRGPILQEFVHEDFQREWTMIFAWGWSEQQDSAKPIETARLDHHARLERHYSNVRNWLEEPV